MALTANQLADLRSHIGDAVPPSDADLDAIYLRRGGLVGVAREVWNKRLANLLSTPASFSLPGEYSQSTAANITAIKDKLLQLAGFLDTDDLPTADDVVGVAQLVRADPAR